MMGVILSGHKIGYFFSGDPELEICGHQVRYLPTK